MRGSGFMRRLPCQNTARGKHHAAQPGPEAWPEKRPEDRLEPVK